MKCDKHGIDMQVMGGHPDNWYCRRCADPEMLDRGDLVLEVQELRELLEREKRGVTLLKASMLTCYNAVKHHVE